MIRIAITRRVRRDRPTLPVGSVGYEAEANSGAAHVWIDQRTRTSSQATQTEREPRAM